MGFDCKLCEEREIWAFESSTYRYVCWECHYCIDKEDPEMKRHRILNKKSLESIKKQAKLKFKRELLGEYLSKYFCEGLTELEVEQFFKNEIDIVQTKNILNN